MEKIKSSDIINASDIGQYHYCSVAWYLQKKGYRPISKDLEKGFLEHEKLGKIIEKTNNDIKKSLALKMLGVLLFILAIITIIFGVVL